MRLLLYRLLVIAFTAAAFSSVALAEDGGCMPVSAIPTTLSEPGRYCLVGPLSMEHATGIAIEIATDDVELDLNGYTLSGTAAGFDTEAVGVASKGRRNITVKNGTVEGFSIGVELEATERSGGFQGGHLVEDLRLIEIRAQGIKVDVPGVVVRRNQIINTGSPDSNAIGILVQAKGTGARVLDNDVHRSVSSNFDGGGILVTVDDVVIADNRISDFRRGVATFAARAFITNNRVSFVAGGDSEFGIQNFEGYCKDNLVIGFDDPWAGPCFDAGGNFPPILPANQRRRN